MLGLSRHVYVLATNRQIPSWLGKLDRRFRHPARRDPDRRGRSRSALILPADIALLGGLFAFGATIAFTIAHLSVIRLRITEPDARAAVPDPASTSRIARRPGAAADGDRGGAHRARLGQRDRLPRHRPLGRRRLDGRSASSPT